MAGHRMTFSTSMVLAGIDPREVWEKLRRGDYREVRYTQGDLHVSTSDANLSIYSSQGIESIVDSMGNVIPILRSNGKNGVGCLRCGRAFNWDHTGIPLEYEDLYRTNGQKILKVERRYCDFECMLAALKYILNSKSVDTKYTSSLTLTYDLFERLYPGEVLRERLDPSNRKYYGGELSDDVYYTISHTFTQVSTIPIIRDVDVTFIQNLP
jgi:hypothetical protein